MNVREQLRTATASATKRTIAVTAQSIAEATGTQWSAGTQGDKHNNNNNIYRSKSNDIMTAFPNT